jgi:hypothetical protein
MARYGHTQADLNGNGSIDVSDLLMLSGNWAESIPATS